MNTMVQTQIERALFAELFGFALTDPQALEQFHGQSMLGSDLLGLYTTTELGEQVCACGAMIPVLGVEAGYYSLIVRDSATASLLAEAPSATSSGWVLHVVSATVVVCGVGYLSRWNPNAATVRRITVPNGWYRATIAVGAPVDAADDYGLEVTLERCEEPPVFTADLSKQLAFTGNAS